MQGNLKLGKGHYHLSGKADYVKRAGQIGIEKGKIVYLDDQSGHYLPTSEDVINIVNVFSRNRLLSENFKPYILNSK